MKFASPGLSRGIGVAAGLDHEARRHDRQTRPLVQEHGQAVRELKRGRDRELQRARHPGFGRLAAPRFVGVDRFGARAWRVAACLGVGDRRAEIRCAGHAVNDDARGRRQLLVRRTPSPTRA